MVQEKITEADTPTIRMGSTPSGLISDPPPSFSHVYARCPSCRNPPSLSWLGTGTKYASLLTRWLGEPIECILQSKVWQLVTSNVAVVDPGTFQEFYKCWKQTEVEMGQVATLNEFVDPSAEVLVKVSQLINCSFGNGRVILTRDR